MLTWILVGVIAISILWILIQRSYIKRLLRLFDERAEKRNQEREEHERELEEEENELKDILKNLASECFMKFYKIYIAFEVGRTESVRKAVRDTFGVFFFGRCRLKMGMEDEKFLDFLREEHPDEFKGVKVKVPSAHEMLLGDLEV